MLFFLWIESQSPAEKDKGGLGTVLPEQLKKNGGKPVDAIRIH